MGRYKTSVYLFILSLMCVLVVSFVFKFGFRVDQGTRVWGFPADWISASEGGGFSFMWLGFVFNVLLIYFTFLLINKMIVSLKETKTNAKGLQKTFIQLMEMFIVLLVGLLVTEYMVKPSYESFGILFQGNVWVNWFGVSYLLFALYTMVVAWGIAKENALFKKRIRSVFFWLSFVGAIFVVCIPFLIGKNPF